jgi:hypothetical protein
VIRFIAILLMTISFSVAAHADTPRPNVIKIPAPIKGNLIIYRVGYTQCSMFLSDEGMAKGTVQPSCVLLPILTVPIKGFEFEIIDVITTTGD